MKSIAQPILAVLALFGAAAFSEEIRKAEPAAGQTEVKVGPISVSVAVTGHEGGKVSKTAYLGVVTAPVPAPLRAQLELAEGMGLSVESVAEDSPAAKAGIRQYDVLKKFNDQMLCSQEQLSVLVRAAGKDAKVSLVLLRGGREQTIAVALGEHDAPEGGKAQVFINGVPGMTIEVHDLAGALKEGMSGGFISELLKHGLGTGAAKDGPAGIQQNMEETRRRNETRRREIEGQIDGAAERARDAARKVEEAARRAGAEARAFSSSANAQSQSVVTIADGEGSVEVHDSNGKRTVKVKDAAGNEIHSGPLNTEADHDAVPESFRPKVKDAESKLKTPGTGVLKKKLEKKPEPVKPKGTAI